MAYLAMHDQDRIGPHGDRLVLIWLYDDLGTIKEQVSKVDT
jgi:hypothetical protein